MAGHGLLGGGLFHEAEVVEQSGIEGFGGQVIELAEAVDATVMEAGEDVHVDGQEIYRQRGEKSAARFRRVGHPQGVAGPGDAGGAVRRVVIVRDADLGFPMVGHAAHQVGNDAGFVLVALILAVNLHVGDTLSGVIDGIADAAQAVDGGAPLLGVQREVGRDGQGLGTTGEGGVQRHFGMDAPPGGGVNHTAKRSVGVVDDQRTVAQA